MTYLVDSDQVADYLKGREPAVVLLNRLAVDGLATSAITYGEIYEGVQFGHDPAKSEHGFRAFLRGADVLSVTRSIAKRFATPRGTLRRQGQPIGDLDLFIAATALERSLVLVTRNIREFGRVPDLRVHGE